MTETTAHAAAAPPTVFRELGARGPIIVAGVGALLAGGSLAGAVLAPALFVTGALALLAAGTRAFASCALRLAADLPLGREDDRRLARAAGAGVGSLAVAGAALVLLGALVA